MERATTRRRRPGFDRGSALARLSLSRHFPDARGGQRLAPSSVPSAGSVGLAWGRAAALALVAGGCAIEPPHAQVAQLEAGTIVSTTAGASNAFVHDVANHETSSHTGRFLCVEPPPDAAFSSAEGMELTVTLIGTASSEAAGMQDEIREIELAGRTPAVLLARELLFRNCEFASNFRLSKDEALALHERTLSAIVANWAVEAANTNVSVGDTVADTTSITIADSADTSLATTAGTTMTVTEDADFSEP